MESGLDSASQLAESLSDEIGRGEASISTVMLNLVKAARERLQMEVSFISEFISGRRVFRYVDTAAGVDIISVGASDPLDESYCKRVADGSLPELIRDAQRLPEAQDLAATLEVPVGAHVSVPIRLSNGEIYGTLCTFSRSPNGQLKASDLAVLRVFADIASALLDEHMDSVDSVCSCRRYLDQLLMQDLIVLFGQPIVRLKNQQIVGFELLARIKNEPDASPQTLFEDALKVGYSAKLGARTIEKALLAFHCLPANAFISFNAAPDFLLENDLLALFGGLSLHRLVVEITEHSAIQDYKKIAQHFAPLRARGARLAIDDAGAGYASLRHILQLKPDIIKLDQSLIRDIDHDRDRQALATALIAFSNSCDRQLIAEGVETAAELEMLQSLGVLLGQGHHFSIPKALDAFAQ